ncbi:ensconsin isoform X5, partial [Tachysurus ichikawai]
HRPLAYMDSSVLSRLLTPTQASLARSKSAAALSADGTDETESHLCPRSVSSTPLPSTRGPLRSRSIDRQKNTPSTTSASSESISNTAQKAEKDKSFTSPAAKRPPSPTTVPSRHRSPSPSPVSGPRRAPSPGAAK